jgi:protein TonB
VLFRSGGWILERIDMIGQFNQPYAGSSWSARFLALAIVVMLHVGLLFGALGRQTVAPVYEVTLVNVVDIPIEPPKLEPMRLVEPKLQSPAPPQVPAPEFSVEDAHIAPPTNSAELATLAPSPTIETLAQAYATDMGGDTRLSGGNAGDGDGSSPSISAFTTCTNRMMPDYPRDAKNRGEAGKVTLLVQLDERGKLTIMGVARSTGSRSLDNAAIAALRRWRCSPVFENGRAVSVVTKQEFEFTFKR